MASIKHSFIIPHHNRESHLAVCLGSLIAAMGDEDYEVIIAGTIQNRFQTASEALEPKWVTARQIESSRVTISRHLKKGGKLWVRIFPDKAITKHPAETRMGKGKGAPDHWAAVVRPGRMLFEVEGLTIEEAQKALKMAAYKLPIKTKFVAREHI